MIEEISTSYGTQPVTSVIIQGSADSKLTVTFIRFWAANAANGDRSKRSAFSLSFGWLGKQYAAVSVEGGHYGEFQRVA